MTSHLFNSIDLRDLTLPNRVIIAPMCQYSAVDGRATDWHLIHLGNLAQSGSGLLIIEASAVEPRGRITHNCLGLYDHTTEEALHRIVKACRLHGNTPIAIQLGHAGRKASAQPPQDGGAPLQFDENRWDTIGPSNIPFGNNWHRPIEMDRAIMDEVITAHEQAVKRCDRIGFDAIELHAAHGYLISSFLSPLANQRTDKYGGRIENRMRFPLEIFSAMRAAWPANKPLGVRFNGTDWDENGFQIADSIDFGLALTALGCDFFDISGGGNSMARPSLSPAYQAPLAKAIKQATKIPTIAVGMIRDPKLAELLIANGSCDMVALARGFLYEPRWTWRAAFELGEHAIYPKQYQRANPTLWQEAFTATPSKNSKYTNWESGSAPHIMVPKRNGPD